MAKTSRIYFSQIARNAEVSCCWHSFGLFFTKSQGSPWTPCITSAFESIRKEETRSFCLFVCLFVLIKKAKSFLEASPSPTCPNYLPVTSNWPQLRHTAALETSPYSRSGWGRTRMGIDVGLTNQQCLPHMWHVRSFAKFLWYYSLVHSAWP